MRSRRRVEALELAVWNAKLDQVKAALNDIGDIPPTLLELEQLKRELPKIVFRELFGEAYQRLAGK